MTTAEQLATITTDTGLTHPPTPRSRGMTIGLGILITKLGKVHATHLSSVSICASALALTYAFELASSINSVAF